MKVEQMLVTEVISSRPVERPRPLGTMSGLIDDLPIPDLLQFFQTTRKNGVLVLLTDGHEGRIYLRRGQVYYATIDGDLTPGPRKSLFRLLAWDEGQFVLEPPDGREVPDELEESTEALLMEGLRQLDEQRELEKDLPPTHASLAATQPLALPLHDLSPEQLDVLQLAMRYRTVGAIFDRSKLTDRDTCEALVHLVKQGYLSVH
jgi:hypothetical protein